ncbi:MAG: ABC transporter ATP-binding protein [Treponema sp.]|jgi:spermidine/putrescine transport system ATP-binding protein|nr:ABC transporter ATP-binding protein [Treponema sp.]
MESTGEQPLLRLEEISKTFGYTRILKNLSLSVKAGEFITLLGSSGCGKTTTLRIIAGLERADSGRVFIAGEDVTDREPNRRNVNMVFQNYALFPHMNVAANIAYSLKLKKLPRNTIRERVEEALAMVQLPGYGRRMPGELSGGQKQRVAVARAMVNRPKLLLLDEPLGALDLQLRRQMQTELKRLQRQLGITFIYITHDQEEALTMSDRIAVMRNGQFEQTGRPVEIYDRPRTSFVARFVGNANIVRISGATLAIRSEWVNMDLVKRPGSSAAGEARDAPASAAQGLSPGMLARVTEKSFVGGQLRITAALVDRSVSEDRGKITASRHGIDSPLERGDLVRVSWFKERAVPVDDGEDEGSAPLSDAETGGPAGGRN